MRRSGRSQWTFSGPTLKNTLSLTSRGAAVFEQYLAAVSKDNATGGQHEIDAIARHFRRNIMVHQERSGAKSLSWNRGDLSLPPLHLAFMEGAAHDQSGHFDVVHYANAAARSAWVMRSQR